MHLSPVSATHPDFPFISQLYIESFPVTERRDLSDWQALTLRDDTAFSCRGIYDEGQCLGFITTWTFDGFVYVEHFAMSPDVRGRGWGARALIALCESTGGLPIVLEVEPPADEMSRRRIRFYERAGLHLSDRPYMQPPYRPTESAFPLLLMTTDAAFLDQHFDDVVHTIHRWVYGVIKS